MKDIAHIYLVLVVCPSITPHSSLSGHGPPISLGAQGEDHSAHTPQEMCTSFLGDPLTPYSPGSGLGGRCGLGLTNTGQHGREVQDEQLHLWVPSTASHIPAPECPVPPPPQPRMPQSRGWGWRSLLKAMTVVPRGQPTCPRLFWVLQPQSKPPEWSVSRHPQFPSWLSPAL